MDMNYIGTNILYQLDRKGLSQVDLARGVGSSKQVINKIIKGRKALKIHEVTEIAQFLGIPIQELLRDDIPYEQKHVETALLSGTIEDRETAEFIIKLIGTLSDMEQELAAHGLS
jgi:transcriptional regulator with XRE-family HTH domain